MSYCIAITGATGFIGRKLMQQHLDRGDHVRILSRMAGSDAREHGMAQWFQGDITGKDDLSRFLDGVDVLYHCAGEIHDKSRMVSLHVEGTRRLLGAARGRIGRWVQLSSVGVYGKRHEGMVTESTPLAPQGLYETTKAQSDEMVLEAADKGDFHHVILRPSIVFGAGMSNQSLFTLISMVKRGLFFFIGKPGASANYIHVDNTVDAMMRCGESPQAVGQIYNLSDYCTIEQFVEYIASALGRTASFIHIPEMPLRLLCAPLTLFSVMPLTSSRIDALTTRVVYPIEKIKRELGYKHPISMAAGLEEMVRAYRQRGEVAA